MSRGFSRGASRGGFSSRGGGGYGGYAPQGPPDTVLVLGAFVHACEGEMVCKSTNTKIPYFNAPVFLENKTQIGKVDEILGPLNDVHFTVKLDHGVVATSFVKGDNVYIGPDKLLPIDRFLPKPVVAGRSGKPVGRQGMRGGRGMSRGGMRGGFADRGGRGRGAPRGGRGSFGASRGSFAPRGRGFAPRGRGGY